MPTAPRPLPAAQARLRRLFAPADSTQLPEQDPEAEPVRALTKRRLAIGSALALILAVFAVRCFLVARSTSITPDEVTHLTRCLHFWATGDDQSMWELGTPRLPHIASAGVSYIALHQAGMMPPPPDREKVPAIRQLVNSGIARVLVPARCVAIASGMALLAIIYWAVARIRGPALGLVAAGLLSMVPEILAHSSIAGSDMPFTAAAILAIVLLARYVEQPTAWRWLGVGLGVGLAWAMRHSGLLLVVLAAGAHLWCALRKPRAAGLLPLIDRVTGSAGACVGLVLVAYTVLWAGDGFGTLTLEEASEHITSLNVPRQVGPIDISRMPVPTSVLSVFKQVSHQSHGHEGYFLGKHRMVGWKAYFPVAFSLKTPIGLLLLMIVAVARFRPRGAFELVCLAFLTLLWISLVKGKVNIGLRYALLTYPLVMPLVARMFSAEALRDRVWGPLTLVATLWFAGASVAAHPRYLSYFNEIGGGPQNGWLYLADSNVDWGQDFDDLVATLKRLKIHDVTLDFFSERTLNEPGLCALMNPANEWQAQADTPPGRRLYDSEGGYIPIFTRYVAISATRLLGLYSHNDMSALRSRKLIARVNDSTFIFDMDQPADRPLCP